LCEFLKTSESPPFVGTMSQTNFNPRVSIESLIGSVQAELKNATPQEWGISGGISLLLCLLYGLFNKRNKDDHALSVNTVFFAAILTLFSVAVRVKQSGDDQYAFTVMLLTVFGLVFGYGHGGVLFLAFVPVIVNKVRRTVKSN